MSAEAVTPNERLKILGRRVDISVPSKSGNFIDLASQLATLFRLLELGEVDTSYISSIASPITRPYALIMGILYNYQQATGKDLKSQVFVNNNNKILSIS
jgi:hypothetical protein